MEYFRCHFRGGKFTKTQHEMSNRYDWRITAQIILFFLISECYTQQGSYKLCINFKSF